MNWTARPRALAVIVPAKQISVPVLRRQLCLLLGCGGRQSMQGTRYRTQWAAQFYTAAELTRRGYLVPLTFGNAPVSDLLVKSPNGSQFTVDVKGQSTRNFWLIQPRMPDPRHFFILVFLPKENTPPQYFIISSDDLMRLREANDERGRTKSPG